jgi:hypothetical protein
MEEREVPLELEPTWVTHFPGLLKEQAFAHLGISHLPISVDSWRAPA